MNKTKTPFTEAAAELAAQLGNRYWTDITNEEAAEYVTPDVIVAWIAHEALDRDDEIIVGERIAERPKPAAPINKSVQHDFIICLEDGKKLKMLKRYLRSTYDLSPDEYRKRWGLPLDYPMVAPAYAARRSEFAKKSGLGKSVRRKD